MVNQSLTQINPNDQLGVLGRRFSDLALSLTNKFQKSETHISNLRKINGEQKLFHLDICVPFVLTSHNTGTSYSGKEITIGFNENYKSIGLPIIFEEFCGRIFGRQFENYIPRIIKDFGIEHYATLYGIDFNVFSVLWHYPAKDFPKRDHSCEMKFENGILLPYSVEASYTDPGKLDYRREFIESDPRSLQRILDECEPWLADVISRSK